ncbi:hypothetical protein, partial [Pseudomonas fluorescens]|uniref:hypothetical protein n=1 Tax=Pseudomonas fluorescens TaxID=294 RepID=UPI001CD305A0
SNPAPATKHQERLLERVAFFVSAKKPLRNNDMPRFDTWSRPAIFETEPRSDLNSGPLETASPSPINSMRRNIWNYFFLQGLVTRLDTPILSRTIQEVIDARQLV